MTNSIAAKTLFLTSWAYFNIHNAHATSEVVDTSNDTGRFREHAVPAYFNEFGEWFVDVSFPPSEKPHRIPALPSLVSISILAYAEKLFKNAGSISLIRSSLNATQGTLVLESGLSKFLSTCVEDSVTRYTDRLQPPRWWVKIDGRSELFDRATLGVAHRAITARAGRTIFVPAVAQIDYRIFDRLRRSLYDSGAWTLSDDSIAWEATTFSNCTETVLQSLPVIEVDELLVLHPKQYVEFHSEGRCSLLIGRGVRGIAVNPLLLRNMNIRIRD